MAFGKFTPAQRHLAVAAGAGFGGILAVLVFISFAQNRCETALTQWQARLQVVATAAADRVDGWLKANNQAVATAAANPTVQIYLGELALNGFDPARVQNGDVKRIFVTTYLSSMAAREGFAGLALYDARGVLVAAAPGAQPPKIAVHGALPTIEIGHDGIAATFAVVIQPVQAAGTLPIGIVVATKRLPSALLSARGTELVLAGGHVEAAAHPPIPIARAGGEGAGACRRNPLQAGLPQLNFGVAATPYLYVVASIARDKALAEVRTLLVYMLLCLILGLCAGLLLGRLLQRSTSTT